MKLTKEDIERLRGWAKDSTYSPETLAEYDALCDLAQRGLEAEEAGTNFTFEIKGGGSSPTSGAGRRLGVAQPFSAEPVCALCEEGKSARIHFADYPHPRHHPFQPKAAPAECPHGCVDGFVTASAGDSHASYPCPDHGTHAKKERSNG